MTRTPADVLRDAADLLRLAAPDDPRIARFELAAADHAAGECHAGLGGLEECAAVAAAREVVEKP